MPAVRAENEVEKGRELGDWKKVIEVLDIGKTKMAAGSQPDALMGFLYAEAKLELWLEEHQPSEKHITKAKSALLDIKKSLQLCLKQATDQVSEQIWGFLFQKSRYDFNVFFLAVWNQDGCVRFAGQSLLCIGAV